MWSQSGISDEGASKYSMSVSMYRGGRGMGRPRTAPPDLPSLLLDARICYLGMPVKIVYTKLLFIKISLRFCPRHSADSVSFWLLQIVPAVTELIVAQFMWLDYDNPAKPIYLYINSSGTQVSGRAEDCIIFHLWVLIRTIEFH